MRYLFVLLLASGCAAMDSEWNACIQPAQFSGDRIKHLGTGKWGTVIKVYGPSAVRCTDPRHPNLASVAWE